MATRIRVVCSVFCLTAWAFAVSADSCVDFTFPTTEVTLDANSSLTEVRFEVVNRCNEPLGDYSLRITPSEGKVSQPKSYDTLLCIIRPGINTENCGCENKEKGLSCYARDTFTRQPFRTWKLDITVNGVTIIKIQHFNVHYPANLTKFYISNSDEGSATVTMEKGHTAQFRCHGDWGNPSSTILLRRPQNNIMDSKVFGPSSFPLLAFSKTFLSCSDSGQYRCEVKGTDQYRALTLLIKCPLEFKERGSTKPVTVKPGGEASVSFHATTYTMDISPCRLTSRAGKKVACNSSKSHVTVSGSLPDVVITVKLTGVTEKGIWTLTVSNPRGSDMVRFHLSVPDPTTTIPTSPTPPSSERTTSQSSAGSGTPPDNVVDAASSEGPDLSSLWTVFGTTLALVALIVIVLSVFVIRMWRKQSRAAGSPDASGPRPQPPDSDEDYLEPVPHRVERSDLDSDDADHRNRKPQGSDEDYLEPEPRRVEQAEPCSSTEPDHAYSEVNPATMIDAARVPAPGANRQRELYESLQMAEVGERSVYSSISKHGTQAPQARGTAPSNKCLIQ